MDFQYGAGVNRGTIKNEMKRQRQKNMKGIFFVVAQPPRPFIIKQHQQSNMDVIIIKNSPLNLSDTGPMMNLIRIIFYGFFFVFFMFIIHDRSLLWPDLPFDWKLSQNT